MNEKAVLNFATKGGWFLRGQKRLKASLVYHGVDAEFIAWNDYPDGCPTHKQAPWGFKPWMFRHAQEKGHRYVIWCDAAVWAIKDIKPIFDHIGEHGHFLFTCHDFDCDQTGNDACLRHFGITREEASAIGSIYACIMGLDLHNPRSVEFLSRWIAAMQAGVFTGQGAGGATDGSGPRYLFHRHDQVCASIIAHQLQMSITDTGYLAAPYAEIMPATVCLTTRGM